MGMALDALLSDQESTSSTLSSRLSKALRVHGYHRTRRPSHAGAIGPVFRFRADAASHLGGKSDPVVESAEQAHRIVSLVMRRMNMIGAMLARRRLHSSRYFYEGEVEAAGRL